VPEEITIGNAAAVKSRSAYAFPPGSG